jgi:predicted dehydrogenase
MTTALLPVGVIGLGRMGQVHARILARSVEGARLEAVADIDADRARRLAGQLGVGQWHDNPEDLLARSGVRAVVIATPSHSHREQVTLAARAGKDILCEKPLALTLEDTDRAIAEASRAGVRLQVGFMRRTQRAYREVHEAIRRGWLGRPVLFRSTQRDPDAPPAAFCDPAVSGGIFVDMGIHEFDLARWLLEDEVESVHAFATAQVFPELAAVGDYDNATVNLIFRGGAIGTVDLSRNARDGEDIRTEVVGSRHGMFVGAVPPVFRPSDDANLLAQYLPQLQAFVGAVRGEGDIPATGPDSRAALAVALAARASAEGGQIIRL